jgi:putative ABC transport system permease protein
MTTTPPPPRLADWLLRYVLRHSPWRDTVLGDVREEFAAEVLARGRIRAGLWYVRQIGALVGDRLSGASPAIRSTVVRLDVPVARASGDRFMRTFLHDMRLGVRGFRGQPLATGVIVATFALGLGVNAAIFNMFDALLIHPFSIRGVDRLVMLSENSPEDSYPQESVSPASFLDWRKQADVFDLMASYDWADRNLAGAREPERVAGFRVSADLFPLVEATPALGGFFTADDEVVGHDKKVVLSDSLWQRRFGSDPTVLGRVIRLDGEPYVVVGVGQAGFSFPEGAELWTPLAFDAKAAANRTGRFLTTIAHLRPGRTIDEARAEMTAIYQREKDAYPAADRSHDVRVRTFIAGMVDVGMPTILALWQVAALLVLLIAGANVANLLLARGAERQRELAVRLALGASRWRVVRQLLAESLVLAVAATPAAVGVAWIALRLCKAAMPAPLVRFVAGWTHLGVDGHLLVFTLAAAMGTAMIVGLFPAAQASRPDVTTVLRDGGRTGTAGVTRSRMRRGLVVAEIALALPLLVASGLSAIGAGRFAGGPQGYDPAGVLRVSTALPKATYATPGAQRQFAERLVESAARVPGVIVAATTSSLPANSSNQSREVEIDGQGIDPDHPLAVNYRAVSPRYLEALRIPMIRGRGLADTDREPTQPVAVISRSMASRFWPGRDAIGRRFRLLRAPERGWVSVVGICGDTIDDWFDSRNEPTMYLPVAQAPDATVNLVARTPGDPASLAPALRAALAAVDPEQPAFQVMTMEEALRQRTIGLRFIAGLMAVFGGLALVLAAVGIYAVMASYVARRRYEIGIRLALGASRRDVLQLLVGQAGRLSLVGVGIGLVLATALARLMESALFGIVSADPRLFAATAVALAGTAIVASLIPARHATRVDPAVTLRE